MVGLGEDLAIYMKGANQLLKENSLAGVRIGYGLSGSFCTFEKSFAAAERLRDMGAELLPIMSYNAANTDTRFGKRQTIASGLKR